MKAAVRRARNRVDPWLANRDGNPVTQLALSEAYRSRRGALDQPLSAYGFSICSQTDEDGILLYLFARVGTTDRVAIEICAGNGIECNSANLILNHGWHGVLVDGDPANVARGKDFYRRCRQTKIYPPLVIHAWITCDNVNAVVEDHGARGAVDLLSLDLDGVDYWIWDALTVISPRVVVIEYQDILGPERSWTVPYADEFTASNHHMTGDMPDFAGASLTAFVRLGRRKGYRLVGVNRYGFNAFFVRDDLGREILPEISPAACFSHPKAQEGMRSRFPAVSAMPWVEV